MGLNRMMMKNGNSIDVFIAYIDRTIRQFEDNALTTVGSFAFGSCNSLTSINLPNVTTVGDYAFYDCNSLMEIHFAVKNKEAIEALSDYSNKFGATNATIYFDL